MNLNEKYNLNKRILLEKVDSNHIAIVKMLKSRIIRKDALKVLQLVENIKKVDESMKISLISTKNICSKSIALLEENAVEIIYREL